MSLSQLAMPVPSACSSPSAHSSPVVQHHQLCLSLVPHILCLLHITCSRSSSQGGLQLRLRLQHGHTQTSHQQRGRYGGQLMQIVSPQ